MKCTLNLQLYNIFLDRREGPTDLFAKILKQKESCNALLEKKNELIATLEDEIREADNQYKQLIEQYHENTAVMSNRMEYQVRPTRMPNYPYCGVKIVQLSATTTGSFIQLIS